MKVAVDIDATALADLAHEVAAILEVQSPAAPEPWLTVDQLAEYLACRPRRVYDLVSQRRIPFAKDGSRLLFRASEVDATFERSHPVCTPAAILQQERSSQAAPIAKAGGHQ